MKRHRCNFKTRKLKQMCMALCELSNGVFEFADNDKCTDLVYHYPTYPNGRKDRLLTAVSCCFKNKTDRYLHILSEIQRMQHEDENSFYGGLSSVLLKFESLEELAILLALRGY